METAAHPRSLFKQRSFGMIFVTLTSSASLWTGVVKTFRWATQANQMDTVETIERIKSKVASKGVSLGEPLPESKIAEFERETGITLPTGYRDFLLHVGNGGDGPPEYGMLPLGLNGIDASATEVLVNIKQPFPFATHWVWEEDDPLDETRYSTTFHGSINLGTDGCAMYWLLIVNGPQHGQIWNLSLIHI